jgi:hypothetical protein
MQPIAESRFTKSSLIYFLFSIAWNKEMIFLTFILIFHWGYTIRNFHENQQWLKVNDTHQLLVWKDNNFLAQIINTTKKNTEVLLVVTKEGCEK